VSNAQKKPSDNPVEANAEVEALKKSLAAEQAEKANLAAEVETLKARLKDAEAANADLASAARAADQPMLSDRTPLKDWSKDELALGKKLGVSAGDIFAVNLQTGTIVTVDGRKVTA